MPSKAEVETLFESVGKKSIAGSKLKSRTRWKLNGNGTDASRFSALPAGCSYGNGVYDSEGDYAYFWSSTESDGGYAFYMVLLSISANANLDDNNKDYGFSVRCIKD